MLQGYEWVLLSEWGNSVLGDLSMYASGMSERLKANPNSRSSSKPQMYDCWGSNEGEWEGVQDY